MSCTNMLSYMLPVEDKSHPSQHLNLDLDLDSDNLKPTKCAANETSDKNCLPAIFESKNISIAFKKSKANDNSFLKTNMASSEVQRPKTLSAALQPSVTSMETVNEDAGHTAGGSILSGAILHTAATNDGKHGGKTSKLGHTKHAALKRVSFGSSKGSMVETLVFETPTPLPEHAEREFGFPPEPTNPSNASKHTAAQDSCNNSSSILDDSGIELQEELERSKVRVTFFQSGKPQLISPPEPQFFDFFDAGPNQLTNDCTLYPNETNFSVDTGMATLQSTIPANYDRQISTESGWDNPFRPGGDLSREADEIVNLIKDGKPITPNDINDSLLNGKRQVNGHPPENGALAETVTKTEVSQNQQSPSTGKDKSIEKKNGDSNQSNTQISNSVVPGPQSASHVVVEEKKKKKCACCVIQ